ncbi:MAG: hypothetical protein WBG92_23280, partial [Thiohalocapsa sp.]
MLVCTGPIRSADIELTVVPPFLLEGVAPNLVLTLDNSKSMRAAYLPNSLENRDERAVFSSPDVNKVYYDPSKTYLPGLDADGVSLGNADFSATAPYPYLDCDPDATVDLGADYVVVHEEDFTTSCPDEISYSDNPAASAFYHLYDPDNYYNRAKYDQTGDGEVDDREVEHGDVDDGEVDDGETDDNEANDGSRIDAPSSERCNSFLRRYASYCRRCGEDFLEPDEDTPDACFDRVLVGGAADLLIARCADMPEGTAGITAQDTYGLFDGSYSDSTGLDLDDRIDRAICAARDDDIAIGDSEPERAKTNFANWYRYHRSRLLVAKTALSRVMHTLGSGVRLAYQPMREGGMWEYSSGAFADLAATFDSYGETKSEFFAWMFGLTTIGDDKVLGASHVRAGEFVASNLAQADDIDAERDGTERFAANSCGIKCRNNFHLMFTDGGWEDRWGDFAGDSIWPCKTGGGDCWINQSQDSKPGDFPENPYLQDYDPKAFPVFADRNVGMLADIVFYYWRTDFDPDSDNKTPPIITSWDATQPVDSSANFYNPTNDPAT